MLRCVRSVKLFNNIYSSVYPCSIYNCSRDLLRYRCYSSQPENPKPGTKSKSGTSLKPEDACPKPPILERAKFNKSAASSHNSSQSSKSSSGSNDEDKKNLKYGVFALIVVALASGLLYGLGYLGGSDNDDETRQGENKKRKKDEKDKNEQKERVRLPLEIVKDPLLSSDIPKQVQYLLIGGGAATFSAFRTIKSLDPKAQILVITEESDYPYLRPPLSKSLWFNEDREDTANFRFKFFDQPRSLFFEPDSFYTEVKKIRTAENGGIAAARGWKVVKIDPYHHEVELEDGRKVCYNKCLIATGGRPKIIPPFKYANEETKNKIFVLKTKHDFEDLYHTLETKNISSITIVGAGFIGCELASSLSAFGKGKYHITQVFKEPGVLGKVLPEYLSLWSSKQLEAQGIQIIPNSTVKDCYLKNDGLEMKLDNDKTVNSDITILAVGFEPNTQLARDAVLETDPDLGGFVVNQELQATTDLYVAGDVACYFDPKLGRRRVTHIDHALMSGRLAGENMLGAGKPFTEQSMYASRIGPNVNFEAMGLVDSSLPTVGVFAKADKSNQSVTRKDGGTAVDEDCGDDDLSKEDFCRGVIFYLKNHIIVGVLTWNLPNRLDVARQVLLDDRKYDDLNEVAKLFGIHEETQTSE